LGRSHTVILSSHILPEVQAVCERVVVINNGRLVADGTPDNLSQEMTGNHKLIVRMAGREQEIRSGLLGLNRIKEVASLGSKEPGACDFSVEAEPGVDLRRDLFALASRGGWPILALKNNDLTLEDVFLRLTGGGYEMPAGKKEAAKK
ncbi:MAG TPA: ABC transporter, partial [Ruminococcaceae bacterium]|nr:ABC transporter [Oscillospiraceae bacterium]